MRAMRVAPVHSISLTFDPWPYSPNPSVQEMHAVWRAESLRFTQTYYRLSFTGMLFQSCVRIWRFMSTK